MSKSKSTKEIPELNTLKVLLQSLKSQLKDLELVNKNIDNIKSKNRGINTEEKKGKL